MTATSSPRDVRASWAPHGVSATHEGARIVATALGWLGLAYGVSRYGVGGRLDCSSLVSQAHWEGAGILVPFTAHGQCETAWATDLGDVGDLQPGDVLVRCDDRGLARHVALVAGWDADGTVTIVEATEAEGTHLAPLYEFGTISAARRFKRTDAAQAGAADHWQPLARAIPKLSRHGARLTRIGDGARHRGFDIQLSSDKPVEARAPFDGEVSELLPDGEDTHTVVIRSADSGLMVSVSGVSTTSIAVGLSTAVGRSSPLGWVAARPRECNRVRHMGLACHVQLAVQRSHPRSTALAIDMELGGDRRSLQPGYLDANLVYAVRMSWVSSPIAATDLAPLWTPAPSGSDAPS